MLLLAAFVVPWATHAQVTYTCDFESGSDGWTFLNSSGCGWFIGTAEGASNGGSYGLYVSTDGGDTYDSYTSSQVIYAYRDVSIVGGTTVDISYDWVCEGETPNWDYMRVFLAPASASLTVGSLPSGVSASALPSGWIALDGGTILNGQTTWTTKSLTGVTVANGGSYRLVFLFRSDGSTQNDAPAVDNIVFTYTEPSCVPPTALVLTPSATTASFSWDASTTAVDSYQWLYTEASGTPDWTAATSTTSTSAEIEGLTATTSYVAYVRSNCGSGDYSDPVSVPFTTDCEAITVTEENHYTYGFETAGEFSCWKPGAATRYQNSSYSTYSSEGDWCLRIYGSSDVVVMPVLNDVNTLQIDFYLKRYSSTSATLELGYVTSAADVSTFVPLKSYSSADNSSYTLCHYNLVAVPADARVAFRHTGTSSYTGWYIDSVAVSPMPSCVAPSDPIVTGISTDAATFGWTVGLADDDTWEVEYSADGENWLTTGPVNDNPTNLINLTSNTEYQVRVRTLCNGGTEQSDWSAAATFRTECDAIVVDADNPYVEGFESGFPDCWDNSEGTTDNVSYRWSAYATGHTGAGLRFNSYNNSNGKTNYLSTPSLVLTVNSRLVFWYKNPTGGDFSVYISTDGGVTRSELATGLTGAASWTQQSIDLSAYTAETAVLYFKGTSNFGSGDAYIYLDEMSVEAIPSCVEPAGLTVAAVAANEVSLSWTDQNEAAPSSWTVAYGPADAFDLDDPATYSTLTATSAEATIPNLDGYTNYKFAVRADCGPSEASAWSSSVTVGTLPDCGTQSGRQFTIGNGTSTSTNPFYYSSYTNYTYGGAYISFTPEELAAYDLYEGSIKGVALAYAGSSELTMPVKVYARLRENGVVYFSGSDASDTTDMTLVYDGELTFAPGADWTEIVFDEPFAYDGTSGIELYFRRDAALTQAPDFYYTSAGSYSDGYYAVYNYGNTLTSLTQYTTSSRPNVRFAMCVSEPDCLAPLNFAKGVLTPASAVLTWTNRSDATSWQLHYGDETLDLTADDVTFGTVDADSVRYTLSGLEPNTDYSVTLRSICGEGDASDWTSAVSFRTPCLPRAVDADNPFVADADVAGFNFECWTNEHISGPGSNLWQTSTDKHHSGTSSFILPDMSATTYTHLVTPGLTLDPAAVNGYQFSFWMYRVSSTKPLEGVRVWVGNSPVLEGATQLFHIRRGYNQGEITEATEGWYEYKAVIPSELINDAVYVILEGISEFGNASYIDDITVSALPSCVALTAFDTVGEPDVDQVTLTWKEYDSDRPLQYLVEYTAAGADRLDTARVPYADVTDDAVANTIGWTLTGLAANTAYSVRVAAMCQEGDTSEWTSVVSFRTACSTFDLPYTAGFETADLNSAALLPFCWQRYNSADANYPRVGTSYVNGGSRSLAFNVSAAGATTQLAILPQLSEQYAATTNRIVFYVRGRSALDSALTVGVMTDPAEASTFTEVAHINATTAYAKHKITLPVGAGHVAIRGNRPTSGTSSIDIYVDDVTLEIKPGCEQPEGFVRKGAVTSSAALPLAWLDGEASEWQLEVSHTDAEGETVTESVAVTAVTRGTVDADSVYYTLSGLEANTTYSLRLRAVCGEGQYSAWADATVMSTSAFR